MERIEPDVQPLGGPDPRRCAECNRVLVGRRADATWCSARCRMRWKRKQGRLREARDSYSAVHPDVSLTELHERARPPQHWAGDPREYSDYGLIPGDAELADEIDAGVHDDDTDPEWAGHDARTPRETWRKWRAYGKRHGTEDPEQTADRVARHQAAEAAQKARIDAGTAGRIQDRYDRRTAGNIASNANASRRLNARHAEQPPVMSPRFDFQAEQITGDFYRGGRPSGQRSRTADYAWDLGTTGFIHTGF
jgi:hypothetical protein